MAAKPTCSSDDPKAWIKRTLPRRNAPLAQVTARRLQQMIRIGVLRVPEVVDSSEGFQTMPNKRKAEQLLKEIKEREHGRPIRSSLRERRWLFF